MFAITFAAVMMFLVVINGDETQNKLDDLKSRLEMLQSGVDILQECMDSLQISSEHLQGQNEEILDRLGDNSIVAEAQNSTMTVLLARNDALATMMEELKAGIELSKVPEAETRKRNNGLQLGRERSDDDDSDDD